MKAPMKATGRAAADKGAGGRQKMWEALRAHRDHITVAVVADRSQVHRSTVLRYLQALTKSGHVQTVVSEPGQPSVWKLVNNVGHHAPRVRKDGTTVTQGDITLQLWTAMCGLDTFDARDLIQTASIEIPEATAKDYCKRLLAAGYLRVVTKADPHLERLARYRLIRKSGPQAPQVQRVPQIYDPNSGTAYPLDGRL